jgi:hypothetical protein
LLSDIQRCPTPGCGWETTAEQWHASWKHRELLGTAIMPAIETYMHDYPLARTTGEQMVCIDQLIHSFHISLQNPGKLNRSVANNLIEGSHDQVVQLLDRLFAIPGGVDKEQWRANIAKMYKGRRAQE